MNTMNKSYIELIRLSTFEERFEYLRMAGLVGIDTFGYERYLNQVFYRSPIWKTLRNNIIVRDEGCDLGILDRPIFGKAIVHHINPLTLEAIQEGADSLFDMNNLITVSHMTHNAIHYGDVNSIIKDPVERRPNDTTPWGGKQWTVF